MSQIALICVGMPFLKRTVGAAKTQQRRRGRMRKKSRKKSVRRPKKTCRIDAWSIIINHGDRIRDLEHTVNNLRKIITKEVLGLEA